ncbi:2101_t:CDS:1, partial [Dentiscutata heterogama]
TASLRNKMSVIQMQQELLKQSQEGEINETNIPEISTISN